MFHTARVLRGPVPRPWPASLLFWGQAAVEGTRPPGRAGRWSGKQQQCPSTCSVGAHVLVSQPGPSPQPHLSLRVPGQLCNRHGALLGGIHFLALPGPQVLAGYQLGLLSAAAGYLHSFAHGPLHLQASKVPQISLMVPPVRRRKPPASAVHMIAQPYQVCPALPRGRAATQSRVYRVHSAAGGGLPWTQETEPGPWPSSTGLACHGHPLVPSQLSLDCYHRKQGARMAVRQ